MHMLYCKYRYQLTLWSIDSPLIARYVFILIMTYKPHEGMKIPMMYACLSLLACMNEVMRGALTT